MFDLLPRWFVLMADVSLKALLLAGVTGLLLRASRIRNSSLKHAAWLGVLGSLLGLPLLSSVTPAIPFRGPFRRSYSLPRRRIPRPRPLRPRPWWGWFHRPQHPRRQRKAMPLDARDFHVGAYTSIPIV